MSSQRLLFVFNPKSGTGVIRNHLVDIVDIMVKAGFEVTIYTTQSKGDAKQKIAAEGAGYDRIVCSGGDGTLKEVVEGIVEADLNVPLGYIPTGSTNDFASSAGIPSNMQKAAKVAVGKHIEQFDVGQLNGENFVYVAAFGLFTEVSYETPQELKNALGHAAYILSAAKSLSSIPSYLMHIETDKKTIDDHFIYGMISNSTSVGGFKGMTGKDVDLRDGMFEVTLIKNPKDAVELNEIIGYLTGAIKKTKMVYAFKTSALNLCSNVDVAWSLDGEFGGKHSMVTVKNLCKRVQIFTEKQK